jgi:dienelactone hydrolase
MELTNRDVVEGYLFPDGRAAVDHHLALGVSLGGHSVWQLMFCEPRITAGVAVIGCPDYMSESSPTLYYSHCCAASTPLPSSSILSKYLPDSWMP